MIGFFDESENNRSANRLIFIIGMFWLMGTITFIISLKAFKGLDVSWGDLSMFFGTIAGVLTAGKVSQKAMEKTIDKPEQK